jgi:hypothetical protein
VPDPTAVGVYETEHFVDPPEATSVHASDALKAPDPVEAKSTVPVGVPPPGAETVAVHEVD